MFEGSVEMHHGLQMNGDSVGAGCRERLEQRPGVGHHQVNVQRQIGQPADRGAQPRAEGEIGDEDPVHHVEVDQVCPCRHNGCNLLADP